MRIRNGWIAGLWLLLESLTAEPVELPPWRHEFLKTYQAVEVGTTAIRHRELHEQLNSLLTGFPKPIRRDTIGYSLEGRSIHLIRFGQGSHRVLMWSQMHGDEPTATLAILDILAYIKAHPDQSWLDPIWNNLEVLIVPMLNPDGAERNQRRNAQDIDINRDARRLQTPEGRLLKSLQERYQPEYAFNLHDQTAYNSVGNSKQIAAFALLAPAFDEKKSDNAVRDKAKRVCGYLHQLLSESIPGHIARYDDEFEPRAFGDNIQYWGSSTILIESGGWPHDPEKNLIRRYHTLALAAVLHAIATETITTPITIYESIPFNQSRMMDLIIRNATLHLDTLSYQADLGINLQIDYSVHPPRYCKGMIQEIGDLSTYCGITEIDAQRGDIYPGIPLETDSIRSRRLSETQDSLIHLWRTGYHAIQTGQGSNRLLTALPSLISPTATLIAPDSSPFRFSIRRSADFSWYEKGELRAIWSAGRLVWSRDSSVTP